VLTSAAAMQDNQSEHSSSTESLDREESKVEDLTSSTSNLSLRMRVPQRPDAVNSRAGLVSPPVSKRAKFPIHVSSGPNARQSSFQSPPSRNAPHTAYQSPSTRNAPLVKHHFSPKNGFNFFIIYIYSSIYSSIWFARKCQCI
jgi:hypothetical protein